MVTAFVSMKTDLAKEKGAMNRIWAKESNK